MRCHRLLISRQYLFNNSWNTFGLSGNERKKVSNVIFVFFWGTEVEKNIWINTENVLSNPNIEHEMKNEEWIRSIYTSSNTHTLTHTQRDADTLSPTKYASSNIELGNCLWLVFIFVNPIELHTYVSFLSKTQCKMRVCVYAFWYEIHSRRWAYAERDL